MFRAEAFEYVMNFRIFRIPKFEHLMNEKSFIGETKNNFPSPKTTFF